MASESDPLHTSLANVADLEDFIHELHERLGERNLKHGDDLSALASEVDLEVPGFLGKEPLTYGDHAPWRGPPGTDEKAGSRGPYGHDVRRAVPHGKPRVMAPEQAFSSESPPRATQFSIQVHDRSHHDIEGRALVLVRPSGITNPVAELKIFCGRWGRYTICLECGWIWCKIVIYGRF